MKTFRSRSGARRFQASCCRSPPACRRRRRPRPYLGLLPAGRHRARRRRAFPSSAPASRSPSCCRVRPTSRWLHRTFVKQLKNNPMYTYRPISSRCYSHSYVLTSIVNKFKERFARVELVGDFRGVAEEGRLRRADRLRGPVPARVQLLLPVRHTGRRADAHLRAHRHAHRHGGSPTPHPDRLRAGHPAQGDEEAVGPLDAAFDAAIR